MYFTTDPLYKIAKEIKLRTRTRSVISEEMTNWARKSLKVNVLDTIFLWKNNGKLPSLQIILEYPADYNFLHGDRQNPYNKKYNLIFAKKYIELAESNESSFEKGYVPEDFHFSYFVFSSVAMTECLGKISKEELDNLKRKYSNNRIWDIHVYYQSVIIFFLSEPDVDMNQKEGINDAIISDLHEIIDRYDDFNYSKFDTFYIRFDSKQNFDEKFKGSWQNYYR